MFPDHLTQRSTTGLRENFFWNDMIAYSRSGERGLHIAEGQHQRPKGRPKTVPCQSQTETRANSDD